VFGAPLTNRSLSADTALTATIRRVTVTFRVLGAVEAFSDGTPVALSGKPLALLACLLVRANSTVSIDALVAALWSDTAAHGKGAIQTYVRRLRRALGDEVVQTRGTGYRIDAAPAELDLMRFQALMSSAEQAMAAGDDAAAAARFGEAVALWRGPALDNVDSDVLHREDAGALNEQRLAVWQQWAAAQLRLGNPPIAELTRLTGEHPLHEPFWQQLMQALHRAGRTPDALAAYRQLSAVLSDELGLDPSPPLQELHQAILTGELIAPATAPPTAPPRPRPATVPRQLSAPIDGFRGRSDELAQLVKLASGDTGASAVIAAIEGTAGVGKTTLAVRFAHEVADRFPDGHIEVNLRGYGPGEPMTPSAALEQSLQALGVAGDQIPATLEERAALWRTHTSGRRILVLLDNARSSDQVRPLLPGPGGLVLITSRSRLPGLTAREGAGRVSLQRLAEADALDLLSSTVGAHRVHADREASCRFVARCAHLPLAIRILGEYAEQQPDRSLAEFVDELDAEPDRLAYFDLDDGDDTNLRVIFAHSYAALDDASARLFRLLSQHPGRDFGVPAAAALANLSSSVAQRLLQRLARSHLLEQPRPGRYEFHDLLREFATTLAAPDEEDVALRCVLDWYLHAALRACDRLRAGWADRVDPPPGLQLPDIADPRSGMAWYAVEHHNLIAAVTVARDRQLHWYVCRLVLLLRPYFNDLPLRDGWVATHEIGLESARVLGDRRAEGRILCGLGLAHSIFGAHETATSYCRAALAIAREHGLLDDEFSALNNLSIASHTAGDFNQAIALETEALSVAQRLGARRLITMARNNLANNYLDEGRFDDALVQAQAALDGLADEPDQRGQAIALLHLAAAQSALGGYTASLSNFRRSLALFEQLGGRLAQAEVLERIGDLDAQMGNVGGARQHLAVALEMLTELGHRHAERVRGKLAAVRGSGG